MIRFFRRLWLLTAFIWVMNSIAVLVAQEADTSAPKEFQSLFDGNSLRGWHGQPMLAPEERLKITDSQTKVWAESIAQHWRVEGGEIVNDGQGEYLTTDDDFSDFELLIQYKTVPNADSGIYLRGYPQVQIWDSNNQEQRAMGAQLGSGGLWNNAPGSPGKDPIVHEDRPADKPHGEWNQFRIVMVGERVDVWLNEQWVVRRARMHNYFDRQAPLLKSGPIQLQTHGGEIRWKSIFIRPIDTEEANMLLRQSEGDGFHPLFNGSNIDGWSGSIDNYEVVDGAIQCKTGKGGVLYSKESFGDFQLAVEFQLPPAGNNGLAIRYPGESAAGGDGAYVGMCELQVLDDEHENYLSIDPRQRHASAYGMVAAKLGYLRPTGKWNHQLVTVLGSKIQVELNGTKILDTDLSTIGEFLDNKPHPGKDRTSGHIGLAGHSDPVRYRLLNIKSDIQKSW